MVETPHGVLEMPEFGLTEEDKAYRGPLDDRRALMAHRKWLQVPRAAVTQLLAEGACWVTLRCTLGNIGCCFLREVSSWRRS